MSKATKTPKAKLSKRPERPRTIDVRSKATLDYVRDLAACGMYEKHISACLGYNPQYFVALKKLHPELAEALKEGTAQGIAKVSGALMDEIEERNTVAILFYLKAKAGWRDNDSVPEGDADGDSGSVSKRILDDVRKVRGSRGRGAGESNPG